MNRELHALAATLTLSFGATAARAQDGANDPSFNTLDDGAFGEGARSNFSSDADVWTVARQPDGRLWIGGAFRRIHGAPWPGIARLNPDGSIDPSFTPGGGLSYAGSSVNGAIRAMELQPDGRALIAGLFDSYDGVPRSFVARTLSSGALDPSFTPPALAEIYALALQPDGRVVVGGRFATAGGAPRSRIARLNADGSLDASFAPGAGAAGVNNPIVCGLALLPDGRILAAGEFTTMDGAPRARIARLMPDGSLDASFVPGAGLSATACALALQPDGAVIVGGNFQSAQGANVGRLVRLLPSGALDPSFNAGAGASSWVQFIRLQPDGRALIGGYFTTYDGVPSSRIARINADGSRDVTFDSGAGLDGFAQGLVLEASGEMIVIGGFNRCDGVTRRGFARLSASGAHDTSFNPGRGADQFIAAAARRPDGKLLIAGGFERFNDEPCNRVARLNTDGSFDSSYGPGAGPNAEVRRIQMQPDGRALLAGSFTQYDGVARTRIARVDAQGALDPSFDPGTGPNGYVHDVLLQPDGKLLVAGYFTTYDGVSARRVARALANGQRDSSFDAGAGPNDAVYRVALQPDGRVLAVGPFTQFAGAQRARIARLNSDGSLDPSFDPGVGPNDGVFSVAVEPSGSILIGGDFTTVSGRPRGRIARLHSDGSLDLASFVGVNMSIGPAITVQLDGTVLLHGWFWTYNSLPRRGLARIFPNGALDPSFDPGTGANSGIGAIVREPGGDLVIAGDFTQYDGVVRHRIARVKLAWIDWVNYCTSALSSQGCTPSISASGSPSVSTASGFTIAVQGVDGAKQGLVYYALGGRASTPLAPGSSSFFCVRGPLQRMGVQNSGGATGSCAGSFQQDWLAYLAANPGAVGAPFAAGINVQAQAWYRDPPAPKSVALSNALEFITVP